MRFFIEICYNGTPYHGWQRQPNAVSVQEQIENALSVLLRKEVPVTGAGRTDTGVHAKKMYAHFDVPDDFTPGNAFLRSFNKLTDRDIVIRNVISVPEDAHARFDALNRTYKYFIGYKEEPFIKDNFCYFSSQLDLGAMNEAAKELLIVDDFTSFAKLHSDNKTNICKVTEAKWRPIDSDPEAKNFLGNLSGSGIVFTITADRFLRNMVRAIVGTLVEVGRKKISIDRFKEIIEKKNRGVAGTSMPAQGLYLWDIIYPESYNLN